MHLHGQLCELEGKKSTKLGLIQELLPSRKMPAPFSSVTAVCGTYPLCFVSDEMS